MPNVKKGLMGAAGAGGGGNKLYTWGGGTFGQLAQGSGDTTNKSSPVLVENFAADSWGNASISCFGLVEGNVYAWGHQTNGILANNGATSSGNTFAPPFTQITGDQNFAGLSEGCDRSVFHATKTNGTLWAWGDATSGMLGDGTTVAKSSPVQIGSLTDWGPTAKIRGSNMSVWALKSDNVLWGWGQNRFGSLGANIAPTTTYSFSSPVQIKTGIADFAPMRYGCAAISTSGELWSWGLNNQGKVGDGTTTVRSSPVQIGSLTTWSKIGAINDGFFAVKTDGTLWAWGVGSSSYMPWNSTTNYSSPVQIGTLTDWLQPNSLTGFGGSFCIKTDGTLWAWGRNKHNIFQDAGYTTKFSSPVQVGSQTHYGLPNKFYGSAGFYTVARIAKA
tara:strand:- start:698 stop:1864 length:1167 start_codon:yes stop_codon:yes gene_type:complete